MKVKVITEFIDRETKELKELDSVHEYEDARAKSLIAKGFVEKVSDKPETGKAEKVAEIEQDKPEKTSKKTTK